MMLNERIKALRLSNRLNQIELALKLNVTKQTVSNWENNNIQPSIDMLVKLSDIFGVTTDYLLGKENTFRLNVDGLNKQEIAHINFIISDLQNKK